MFNIEILLDQITYNYIKLNYSDRLLLLLYNIINNVK